MKETYYTPEIEVIEFEINSVYATNPNPASGPEVYNLNSDKQLV